MNPTLSPVNAVASATPPVREPAILRDCLIFFVVSFLLLFLAMPRDVNAYDEGLTLTGSMRVLAGQVPHRDFYANYGPAEFYSFAFLFKLFGQSVFVERMLCLVILGLTVATAYAITVQYCRRSIAIGAGLLTLLWLYGIALSPPAAILPFALLSALSCQLLMPVFEHSVSWRRAALAGVLSGIASLYRYDAGLALLLLQVFAIGIAAWLRNSEPQKTGSKKTESKKSESKESEPKASHARSSLHLFASAALPYLAAFFVITLPVVIAYLAVAPLHDFVHDILIYPGKYYRRERGLPFPGVDVHRLQLTFPNLGVYLPLAAVALSLYVLLQSRRRQQVNPLSAAALPRQWKACILVFALLAFAMYFKGVVRIGPGSMYLSMFPTLLLIALLLEKQGSLSRPAQLSIRGLALLTVVIAVLQGIDHAQSVWPQRSVSGRILRVLFFPHRGAPGTQATWCKVANPVTKGFCFMVDDGRVNTIEFLAAHTRPGQTLFVGLDHNDKVFANDNMMYFATQRLPATKWSHFDPGLQNTLDIQQEMVQELERNAPPYIVLDSEFKNTNEPNDSSKSTGVLLLDNYIHSNYQLIQTFDEMAIWQRIR